MAAGTYKQKRQHALAFLMRSTSGAIGMLGAARHTLLECAHQEYDNQIKAELEQLAYLVRLATMQIDAANSQAKAVSARVVLHNLEQKHLADSEEKISETTQNEAPPP